MKTLAFTGIVVGSMAVACGDASEPASPLVFTTDPNIWAAPSPESIQLTAEQPLTVEGHLEGTLRGVELLSDTTQNYGYYSKYDDGNDSLSASIAASGDGGAGMLIVNLVQPELRASLLNGHWSSTTEMVPTPLGTLIVSSCAGPTIGEWPYEIGPNDYEMDASEAPERPGIVVLSVTAHFPRTESDSSSETELVGTLRFELPAQVD